MASRDIGATVVETEFEVKSDCSSGIAVTNPVREHRARGQTARSRLLGLRDTIRGYGILNWTAGKPMSEWMGVTVDGTPQRAGPEPGGGSASTASSPALLGNLTGLRRR